MLLDTDEQTLTDLGIFGKGDAGGIYGRLAFGPPRLRAVVTALPRRASARSRRRLAAVVDRASRASSLLARVLDLASASIGRFASKNRTRASQPAGRAIMSRQFDTAQTPRPGANANAVGWLWTASP